MGADRRNGSKEAKAHVGFDINWGIPRKIYVTGGKEGERPFVDKIIKAKPGSWIVAFSLIAHFDQWQIS